MKLIGQLLVNTLALLICAYIIPGVLVDNIQTAVVASIVIGTINTFIKPVLKLITLPITILTLGIFSIILNVLLLMLAAYITPGFHVDGFITALILSLALSLISSFLGMLVT